MNQGQDLTGPMSGAERRATIGLSSIFVFRMLGLFMILPVFSLFAEDLRGTTPFLTGLAISVYGLTQAIFQIPFGMLSDRFGRKPIIAIGLLIFAVGSLVAADSDSIYGVIFGRALQGAGAIASVVMALTADLTREIHRTKAMAMIGISIGFSFAIALIVGPIVGSWAGVQGIFGITAGFALVGLMILFWVVPNPEVRRYNQGSRAIAKDIKRIVGNLEILRLNLGIFCLHLILTALFVALPLILRNLGLEGGQHWVVYLPVLLGSMAVCLPFVILAEKKRKIKPVFLAAITAVILANIGISSFSANMVGIIGFLFLFFTGFNLLEATLPSLISKIAPIDLKGMAMGVYSTSQFMGAFIGGVCGGSIYGSYGLQSVFLFCAMIAIVWLAIASTMSPPNHLSRMLLSVGPLGQRAAAEMSERMANIEGVAEALVLVDDGIAHLKVDRDRLDRDRLNSLIKNL